jgi:hypothetical protein
MNQEIVDIISVIIYNVTRISGIVSQRRELIDARKVYQDAKEKT